jgi:hypothetical protein
MPEIPHPTSPVTVLLGIEQRWCKTCVDVTDQENRYSVLASGRRVELPWVCLRCHPRSSQPRGVHDSYRPR